MKDSASKSGSMTCLERLFAVTPVQSSPSRLTKLYNLLQLILLGVSCTIGIGAYSSTGFAAAHAGPAVAISYFVTGAMCLFTCFPYVEFSKKIPSAGMAYSYVYASCGELIAYLSGHSLHLILIFCSALAARCWGTYVAQFLGVFGVVVPGWLYSYPWGGFNMCILGAGLVIAFSLLMWMGMKQSTLVSNIVTAINLIVLFFAIFGGIGFVHPSDNYSNFFPKGAHGVFMGMNLAFFAYLGFEEVTAFTEEAKDASRDMPIAIATVLLITTIINTCLSLVMCGMADYRELSRNDSLFFVFRTNCPEWMWYVILVGSIAGLTSSLSGNMLSEPRVLFAMAQDGLLPEWLSQLEYATIFVGVLCTAVTLFFDVEFIGNTVSLAGLLTCVAVDAGVVVSRYSNNGKTSQNVNISCALFCAFVYVGSLMVLNDWHYFFPLLFYGLALICVGYVYLQQQTNIPESYACPCVPFVPFAGLAMLLWIGATTDMPAVIMYLVFSAIGVILYFAYGYSHSIVYKNSLLQIEGRLLEEKGQAQLPPPAADTKP